MSVRFGIAITTFNRRDMVVALVERLRALTVTPFELVVCDDGSADGTVAALRDAGVTVIAGANRGVAWNKNRGIFHLLHIASCDAVLLLDDDMMPRELGWEAEWLAAIAAWGHVNFALPGFGDHLLGGALTAANPGITRHIPGCALGFARGVLNLIGYFDIRFGRYGHEHTDLSFRALRAGYGGIYVRDAEGPGIDVNFFVISGGLALLESQSAGTERELEENHARLLEFRGQAIFRPAWDSDETMRAFLDEVGTAGEWAHAMGRNYFASRAAHFARLGGAAGEEPPPPGLSELGAGCVVTGGGDEEPWGQIDLGRFATIQEVRVGALGAGGRLEISIDGAAWVELENWPAGEAGLRWRGPGTAWGRFVRVTCIGRGVRPAGVKIYGVAAGG